jgi:hypothetical protein
MRATVLIGWATGNPEALPVRSVATAPFLVHCGVMKIAIAMPVHGDTRAAFTLSLAKMLLTTVGGWSRHMPGVPLRLEVIQLQGTVIGVSRELLLGKAEAMVADHILWLDSDQTFPPDTLLRLAKHGLPVVGANYPSRHVLLPTASLLDGDTTVPVYSTPEKIAAGLLEPVDYIGLGVCLMSIDAIREVPKPLFKSMSEDAYCFDRLREAGIRPVVDHALSAEVGHVRDQILTNTDALAAGKIFGNPSFAFSEHAQPG